MYDIKTHSSQKANLPQAGFGGKFQKSKNEINILKDISS